MKKRNKDLKLYLNVFLFHLINTVITFSFSQIGFVLKTFISTFISVKYDQV